MAALLRDAHPDVAVEVVPVSTEGDRRTDVPLSEIGGKGVFAKEVQVAVLEHRADVAVHSAKDLPARTPDGLEIAALPPRGDARDALVGSTLAGLGSGSVVATGSARRRVQLAALVPGLRFAELRGNMATRLAKADGFDAIVVAAVALERLGVSHHIAEVLDPTSFVPQVAQGALAVECRADDPATRELLAVLDHPTSRRVVECERAFLEELGGDCTLPAGAYAVIGRGGDLHLRAVLAGHPDAAAPERHESRGPDGDALGRAAARHLRAQVEGA